MSFPPPFLTIGLTGGIATGKSTVARLLGDRGIPVLQADRLGHELLATGPVMARVVDLFGSSVLDDRGLVDRARLGALVFQREEARRALEQVLHPLIKARCLREMETARSRGDRLFVIEAALLVEVGWTALFDLLVVVDAPMDQRISRLMARDNLSLEQALMRIESQLPMEQKRAAADLIIDNDGTLEVLASKVDQLLLKISGDPISEHRST